MTHGLQYNTHYSPLWLSQHLRTWFPYNFWTGASLLFCLWCMPARYKQSLEKVFYSILSVFLTFLETFSSIPMMCIIHNFHKSVLLLGVLTQLRDIAELNYSFVKRLGDINESSIEILWAIYGQLCSLRKLRNFHSDYIWPQSYNMPF